MTVTVQSLAELDAHWAVSSVDRADREAAFAFSVNSFVAASIGEYVEMPVVDEVEGLQIVERVAMAYEIAAMEGLPALVAPFATEENRVLRAQAQAAAYRAFELRRVIPPPAEYAKRLFAVLRLSALAYSSDRSTDLRRWLDDIETESPVETTTPSWDTELLLTLFDCWLRLLRKKGWDDLSKVAGFVAALRARQNEVEPQLLRGAKGAGGSVALRLVALYHWAKATEVLGVYMTMGTVEEGDVNGVLSQHFDSARRAAREAGELEFELLLRWLEVTGRRMADNSVWRAASSPARRQFVERLAKSQSVLEFLPPQRAALQEQGLLDPERRAVVVDLPTSGGKTTLAEFRMLQALNLFREEKGWVAYVAPTRALVAQMTRRLRTDLGPLGIVVEQLSAAIDVDAFEQTMLDTEPFDVLIATPEKLDLLIRNGEVARPLALVVVDEAHNIEDKSRGLRLELLLANIKRDRPEANFLLLMPYVSNAQDLARWLAPESGASISLGTAAWQPNERLVGTYWIEREETGRPGDWSLRFEGLTTSARTVDLKGVHKVGGVRPLSMPWSEAKSLTKTTAAIARVMSDRGTSIAVARTIPDCWNMARAIHKALEDPSEPSQNVSLVQRFLAAEVSPDFELIELLGSGIGVHHAGLSDEARSLVEWLTEIQELSVLCATTTIAQGINFPVSSVFLASRQLPVRGSAEMSHRAFWNLAGRAGRVGHDSLGMVGLAAGNDADAIRTYVSDATGALVSRLEQLLDEIDTAGRLTDLRRIVHGEDWTDFRSYVAHLWNEKKELDAVLNSTEQLLRGTFGYGSLDARGVRGEAKASALLDATRAYAIELAEHPENAVLADSTGFSPDGVRTALLELGSGPPLSIADWSPDSLFGGGSNSALAGLVGIMMKVPQLNQLRDLVGHGEDRGTVAAVAQAWVNGDSLESIAREFFASDGKTFTESITNACRGIYRTLGNAGSWGLSALSKMPTAGIPHSELSEEQLRQLNLLPAMLYHGVRSEAGVLMRMNSVPRSVAEPLGELFVSSQETDGPPPTPQQARAFVGALADADWQAAAPSTVLSGADYRAIWQRLSGESA